MTRLILHQRKLLTGLLACCALAQSQPSFTSQELLGRVTNTSVTVNMEADTDLDIYCEYGTTPGLYSGTTPTVRVAGGTSFEVLLDKLQPNTRYYYRLQYRLPGAATFTPRAGHSFQTQRPRGSSFTFVMEFDPHMDDNSDAATYQLTLANELADKPDFLITLGDTFMSDKLTPPTQQSILDRVHLLRSYYDIIGHSVPLFLSLGNHEGEWGSNLNSTGQNVAVWDTLTRKKYIPNPMPDSFFSGDRQSFPLVGQRQSYYSWEWGDALFIVLDPYWNQPVAPETSGDWSLTLGRTQYDWLKSTLESSNAAYKFVFAHNLVGGLNMNGPMRGGIETAKYLEWGGYNLDGTWGFDKARPGWPMPVHQLLVANHVTAFFHGHDHLYAKQDLDGIVYQEGPQPSAKNTNLGTRGTDYSYTHGTVLGGTGYLRVHVSPAGAKVDYVETWIPANSNSKQINGMVADSYTMLPGPNVAAQPAPSISAVANAASESPAVTPNSWVEIKGANLAPAGDSRVWTTADFAGNTLPKQLDGVSATVNGKSAFVYYISPSLVNILTPPDAILGNVPVQVTVNGVSSPVFNVKSQTPDPAFFVWNPYVVATHLNGSYVGPTTLYPGLTTPAKPGEMIVLWANGFGATTTSVVAGSTSQSGSLSPLPAISIGGSPAAVQFAGLVSPGVFQLNVTVPQNTPDGDQSITATYNGFTTPASVLLAVQH